MRSEVIEAETIDAAAEQILNELRKDTTRRSSTNRENVIYFDGWDGLGASAVLRTVAHRLAAPPAFAEQRLAPDAVQFDQIIQIDCSKWESRRAVQRAIAEQLELPAWVMEMLDRQDEEDDFNGLAEGSRAEMPEIVTEIFQRTQNHRFVVIFLNGSCEEVDLTKFGLPLYGYTSNKMLWTFRGRFRLNPRMEVDKVVKSTGVTDVFFTASRHEQDPQLLWSYLVRQEAADLVAAARKGNAGRGDIIQLQQGQGSITSDDEDDGPWQAADALQREMQFDVDCWQHSNLQSLPGRTASMPYWTSPPYEALLSPIWDMFPQFDRLGVLKLSCSTFSLSSLATFSCHYNLIRVLCLHHCKDQVLGMDGSTRKEEDVRRCFQRLWVLDVCYTRCDRILSAYMLDLMTQLRELNVVGAQELDMGQLQGRLPNIRKLRVTKSTVGWSSCSENNLISGMDKMELLDFSENHTTMLGVANISEISISKNCLETVIIIDGCVGIQKFSFKGCVKLKDILLSGLFEDLRILDLSGTIVKTLDLSVMTARNLDELFLYDCENLCAIL